MGFEVEDDGGVGGKQTCASLITLHLELLNFKRLFTVFVSRKGIQFISSCAQFRAMSRFGMYFLQTKDKEALFTCIFDPDLGDSRLPWLDNVLLCLDGVGLT